jgi:hypothetical protein
VILAGGALSYRKFKKMEELGEAARRALHREQLRPAAAHVSTKRRGAQPDTRRYEAAKLTAVICHGTSALLKTRPSDGSLLVVHET